MRSRPSRLFRGACAGFLAGVACIATSALVAPATAVAVPDTTIHSGPEGPVREVMHQFIFTGSEDAVRFECRNYQVGDDPLPDFDDCLPPQTVGPLAEGAWVFEVRAVDMSDVPDDSPARRDFTVDTTEPVTTISDGPSGTVNTRTPTVIFSSSEVGTFECWDHLASDSTPKFAPCTSPKNLGPLTDGDWVFEVAAIDAAGNRGALASRSFSVDATAPETTIVAGPAALSNDATPDFAFSSTEAATFECRLVGQTPGFAPCGSALTLGPLGDGDYVFEVVATDGVDNRDPVAATWSFTVDTTPPQTTITGGPGDTTAATAVFLFSAPGAVGFSCRLDGGAWEPCDSPQTYSSLSLGRHQFAVRAVDAAGNQDPNPAQHAWQVLRPGLVIPAAVKQATALARELVQLRRALARIRLRTLARRRTLLFRTFDALTAGTVEIQARTRIRQRPGRRRWVSVLKGERDIPGVGRHRVRAKVTKKARRLARRRQTLPLELRLSFTDLAKRSLWATSKLTLKR